MAAVPAVPAVDGSDPADHSGTGDVVGAGGAVAGDGAGDGPAGDGAGCGPAQAQLQEVSVAALPVLGSGPGRGPEVDPATLLTGEEVSAAFGRPFGPPRSLTPDHALPFLGVRMCEYAGAGQDRARVQIQTVTGRIARALLERVRGEPLPGIGEEAFLRGDTVAVLQGDVGIAIRAQHVDGAITRAALRQLAVTAAARLPTGR
jgi:hypothetical protein